MKTFVRIALPRLAELANTDELAFAVLDSERRLLRSGRLPLDQLAQALPRAPVQALLHPDDAVHTVLTVPPLRGAQLQAAVAALVEPLALSETEALAIAHGPRDAQGQVIVAWTERAPLAQAWERLAAAGLQIRALIPGPLALPADDPAPQTALTLPADARWQAPAPSWSLALPALRPRAQAGIRWRAPMAWAAAATALWLLGLNLYAHGLEREARALRTRMTEQVQQAFPQLTIVIDPLQQARQQRDALRLAMGTVGPADMIPLALAAAQLPLGPKHPSGLQYADAQLLLRMDPPEAADAASAVQDPAALQQQAAALGLQLIAQEDGWRIRLAPSGDQAQHPAARTATRNTP